MGAFFKGWRRKVGVITLVVACLIAGSWGHSYTRGTEATHGFIGVVEKEGAVSISVRQYSDNVVTTIFDPAKDLEYAHQGLIIPHWCIVLPLTLLSAYLILWKPRTKSKEQTNA